MTNATATHDTTQKSRMMKAVQANEWGQITDLEAHQTYYVMRKPSRDVLSKDRANAILEDFRAFLQDQRLVTEKQVQQFQEKYGEPAKAKAKELRQTLEKRFDEIAKEVEARVGKLEEELQARAPQVSQALKRRGSERQGEDAAPGGEARPAAGGAETPGEMPTGEHEHELRSGAATAAQPDAGDASTGAAKKKAPKKSD